MINLTNDSLFSAFSYPSWVSLNFLWEKILKSLAVVCWFIVSRDKSWGYLGFSTVRPPPQRFPFGCDNLKNILVRPFKFGMWVYIYIMPRTLLFGDLDLQFQGHWWPLRGQIWPFFSHFGPVPIYRMLDHPMGRIYNTYICPL